MKCPLQSRCQDKLSDQLQQEREAHKQTIRDTNDIISEKDRQISILQYKETVGLDLSVMSQQARKQMCGYNTVLRRSDATCGQCGNSGQTITRGSVKREYCYKFQFIVNKRDGSCNHNTESIREGAA